jgi:GDPmannose 4,6-dehydratase
MNIALITGITGQDGSYLAEFLLEKNYIVYGIIRRSSLINTCRIDHIFDNKNLKLKYGDLTDSSNILNILYEIKKSYEDLNKLEIYNLGAMSHVKVSFELPEYTEGVNEIGYDNKSRRELIFVDEKYFRPAEVDELLGDSTKARNVLGWKPEISFDDLIKEMVNNDTK